MTDPATIAASSRWGALALRPSGRDDRTVKAVDVELPAEHPGVGDPVYLARRAHIAAASRDQSPGRPPPLIDYSATEDGVWRTVSTELARLHRDLAAAEYLAGEVALDLPRDRVPQLAEVSDRLQALTGWSVRAVPGLVPIREFYGSLAERTFLSTQYVRHPDVPFYTPEPDICHELIGHANALASPRFAALYEAAGRASGRAGSDDELERFSRLFWFTIEFGVVREDGEPKAYGAGLLSSFGEIQQFRAAEMRPFDAAAMSELAYDITTFQPVLFAADSFDQLETELLAAFAR